MNNTRKYETSFFLYTTKQWSKIKPRLTFNERKKVVSFVGHQLTHLKLSCANSNKDGLLAGFIVVALSLQVL
jgi:hypothetical protein